MTFGDIQEQSEVEEWVPSQAVPKNKPRFFCHYKTVLSPQLGVLTYSAVRDIQMQRQLDEYTSRVEALEQNFESANVESARERVDGLCTTVSETRQIAKCLGPLDKTSALFRTGQ